MKSEAGFIELDELGLGKDRDMADFRYRFLLQEALLERALITRQRKPARGEA